MLSNIHCRLNHQFRDNQKASMSLILGAGRKLYNFGTKFELFLIFCLNYFCLEKWGILKNLLFDKNRSRIHKNELAYKFYTILEWDKYQQFPDLIKFLVFWFALSQMWKTFVPFFMHQTLYTIVNSDSCKAHSDNSGS